MLGHGLVFLLHFCQALSLLVSPGFLENAPFSWKKTQEFHVGSPTACQSAHLGRKIIEQNKIRMSGVQKELLHLRQERHRNSPCVELSKTVRTPFKHEISNRFR